MKILLITLFFISSFNAIEINQETQTLTAAFDRIEDDIYYFMDEDDNSVEFKEIDDAASQKYDLSDEDFVGKKFLITYQISTEIDEDDEEEVVYTIIDLELKE